MMLLFIIGAIMLSSSESFYSQRANNRLNYNGLKMNNDDEGYGPVGSLIRQGPVPFFIRLAKPDTYDAAVKKFMALEKCSRIEAQANMDAYFQDPNGWAGNKLRADKAGTKIDYVNVNQKPKELVLTAVWSTGILYLFW
eukprot:CAMPEP_0182418036 /NCGR_PEP_ID=MMETSP1167-20130531/2497_1 /TAXON_ID=2988 /ORGANISM="Mallomonas Sp, Strain CCMP3275" /LENGTH=138 /DNA_ID=CAMNT_0024592001 /DNA_START=47 /DNA_END=460 /DNA_ORIENTATION=-